MDAVFNIYLWLINNGPCLFLSVCLSFFLLVYRSHVSNDGRKWKVSLDKKMSSLGPKAKFSKSWNITGCRIVMTLPLIASSYLNVLEWNMLCRRPSILLVTFVKVCSLHESSLGAHK